MKVLKNFLLIVVIALTAMSCNKTTTNQSETKTPEQPKEVTNNTGDTTAIGADACKLVTKEVIKQQLGLDVKDGQPKTSNLKGSTCNFGADVPLANGATNFEGTFVVVQLSPDGKDYYNQSIYPKSEILPGIGDRAFIDNRDGNYTVSSLKGNNYSYITIMHYNQAAPSAEQVKSFLKNLMAKM